AAALRTVEALSSFLIDLFGKNGHAGRYYRNADAGSRLLDHQLMQPGLGRRQEESIRIVFQSLIGTVYTQQLVYLVVVRFYILVADGPVITQAIDALPLEILGAKSERDTPPVIGPATQHTRSPPFPAGSSFGACLCIRLSIDLPSPIAAIEVAKGSELGMRSSPGRLPRIFQLTGIFFGVEHRARFQQTYFQTCVGQHIGSHPTTGARSYNNCIVILWLFLNLEISHNIVSE